MGKAAARKRAQRAKRQQRQTQFVPVQTDLSFGQLLNLAADNGDTLVGEYRAPDGSLVACDVRRATTGQIYTIARGAF